jgi:hypothetical protein
MRLNLPIFFDDAPIGNVRKVFKLMTVEPWRNEETREKLRQFFPEWEQALKDRLSLSESDLKAAKQDTEAKRRTMASFGSYLDESIAAAKRQLAAVKRWKVERDPASILRHKTAIQSAEAALAHAMKPKTDHEQAAKEVKRLESTVKALKAAIERCGKVTNAYSTIITD